MEDEELVKMFNPTLNRRETILFFLIVVINGDGNDEVTSH